LADDSLRDRLEARSQEDLLDILSRRDVEEWRPEVFPIVEAILARRGVDVASALAQVASRGDDMPDDPPVVVATFMTVVESEACRSALAGAGFAVTAANEFVLRVDPAFGPALGGFKVGVAASEAEDARMFLAAAEAGELAEGLQCVQCGSPEVTAERKTTRSGTFMNALLVGPAIKDVTITYTCRACGAVTS
jgi:hypothetical protein